MDAVKGSRRLVEAMWLKWTSSKAGHAGDESNIFGRHDGQRRSDVRMLASAR